MARKSNPDLKKWLIHKLRRLSLQWPARTLAKQKAWVERGMYRCNACKDVYHYSNTHLDHINPVVNVKEAFTTWDSYIESLFCDEGNFQVLCVSCHEAKTLLEDNLRTIYKKKLDKKKKK